MAVTATRLGELRSTTNTSASYAVTLSRAIAANKPCVAFVFVNGSSPTDVASMSGGGVTWTKRHTQDRGGRAYMFTADGVVSPSGTAITVDMGGFSATGCDVLIYEIDGSDGTPSGWPIASAEAASGSPDIAATFASAPAAASMVLAFAQTLASATTTWTAGFTEDTDASHSAPVCTTAVAYDDASAPSTVTATFSVSTGANNMIAVEMLAAAGGGSVDKAGDDVGSGADAGSLAAADTATDVGSGADTGTVAASDTAADTGSGSDAASAGAPIDATETGAGADTVTATTEAGGPAADTGAGVEAATVAATAPPAADTGSGADVGWLSYAEQILGETGAAAEAAVLSMLAADVGLGTDAVSLAVLAPPHWSILIENESGVMVERREWVRPFTGLSVENRSIGGSGTADIPIWDRDGSLSFDFGRRVEIIHDEAPLYEGFVRVVESADLGWSDGPVLYLLKLQDYSTLAHDDVIETAFRSTVETDKARIAWLTTTFGTKGITAGAEVQALLATMPVGEDGRPEQDFSAKTLGQAYDAIAALSGASWYVDSEKRLHYFLTESAAAPFDLSDVPNDTTLRSYGQLRLTDDGIDVRHRVLVVGTSVKVWREVDPGEMPTGDKVRSAVISDENITTVAQAEAAGDAFLEQHRARRSGRLVTWTNGLRAQQTIEISHLGHGLVAEPFVIHSVRVRPIATERAEFAVTFGDDVPDMGDVVGGQNQTLDLLDQRAAEAQAAIRQMQAAGANLLSDSSFESSLSTEWAVGTGWTRGYASAVAFRGNQTARLLRSNAAAGVLRSVDYIPISRADDYWISSWSWLSALGANATGEIYVEEYNAASTLLATTVVASIDAIESDWTRHAQRFGPTAGVGVIGWQLTTTKIKVGFRAAGSDSTPTITWEVDGVQVERGSLLTAYAPMPEELSNTPGEVVVDASGITIINGALTVKNPGGTVIIDGSSDMFRIVATGTVSLAGPNASGGYANTSTTVTVNTGLTYRPATLLYRETGSIAHQLPLVIGNTGSAALQQVVRGYCDVVLTSQTRVTVLYEAWFIDLSAGAARDHRYYILEQVAI